MVGDPRNSALSSAVDQLAEQLRDNPSVLFVTGAGISADSGLPTYRGVGGLYNDDGVVEGMPIEEALSGPVFRRRPEVTWKYLTQVEKACRGALPNRAHEVIAALEQQLDRCVVLTQNVDGLHRVAGSKEVIEIHGNVHDLVCPVCGWWDRVADYSKLAELPECPACISVIRPKVVLFGEMLPEHAIDRLERELARGFDLVFSVGTTSVFPYIAAPIHVVNRRGGVTVEVNPGESEVSHAVQVRLRAGAAKALGALGDALGL